MFRLLFTGFSTFFLLLAVFAACLGEYVFAGFTATAAVGLIRVANGSFQRELTEFTDMMSSDYKRVEK